MFSTKGYLRLSGFVIGLTKLLPFGRRIRRWYIRRQLMLAGFTRNQARILTGRRP